ncbi:MAG: PAS domain-containing protein, partial [Nitrospirales bacterium]
YAAYVLGTTQTVAHEVLWRKDGTSFPVEYTSTPINDELGQGIGAVVTFRDITERIKTEEAIRASAKERQIILDNVPALIASFDTEHHYRFANSRYLEWFNVSLDSLIGTHAKEFLSEEAYEGLIKQRMDQALAGEIVTYQVQIPHADGSLRWVEAMYVPETDHHGRIQGFFAMVLDIHERKIFEKQVEQLTDRLQLATQSAEIGVWDLDVVNNILTWDDQMYTLYGLGSDTFSGAYEAWTTALHPDDHERAHTALQEALAGGAPFNASFRILWPNQSIHHIRAFATVHRNTIGEVERMIGVNWDITEEKAAEEELTAYIENLRRSNSELEQFAYVASHDLQEPLRKIRNFSELLEARAKDHLPAEALKYLAPIVDGAVRMQTLVQDLLTYSRVARGELTVERVDLQKIVEQVTNNLEAIIADGQARITLNPLPTIEANLTQMEQLFQNLIGNGLKYHGPNIPSIEVSVTKKKQYWEFAIRDNGIGFDQQYADRIFVIFQRLHTKKEYAGTGIGLAICKKIVELHGGEIWVESTPNEGSTFFFTLPTSHAHDPRGHETQQIRQTPQANA